MYFDDQDIGMVRKYGDVSFIMYVSMPMYMYV